jgi:hypothetical protein
MPLLGPHVFSLGSMALFCLGKFKLVMSIDHWPQDLTALHATILGKLLSNGPWWILKTFPEKLLTTLSFKDLRSRCVQALINLMCLSQGIPSREKLSFEHCETGKCSFSPASCLPLTPSSCHPANILSVHLESLDLSQHVGPFVVLKLHWFVFFSPQSLSLQRAQSTVQARPQQIPTGKKELQLSQEGLVPLWNYFF